MCRKRTMRGEIEALTRGVVGVGGIDEIRAHRFGPYLVLNLTIAIDGTLTVAEGDAIASRVEATLVSEIRFVREVHVHYHPPHAQVSHGGGDRSAG